jgi:hypothetical protein
MQRLLKPGITAGASQQDLSASDAQVRRARACNGRDAPSTHPRSVDKSS